MASISAPASRVDTFDRRRRLAREHDDLRRPVEPPLVHLAALQGATLLLAPVSSALEAVGADFDNPGGLGRQPAVPRADVRAARRDGEPRRPRRRPDVLGRLAHRRCVRPHARAGRAARRGARAGAHRLRRRAPRPLPAADGARRQLPLFQRELARIASARAAAGRRESSALPTTMRDFMLDRADRAFRAEVRDFLARELEPRAADIENTTTGTRSRTVVAALGEAGYLRLMFPDLYLAARSRNPASPMQRSCRKKRARSITRSRRRSRPRCRARIRCIATRAPRCATVFYRHRRRPLRRSDLRDRARRGSDTSRLATRIELDAARDNGRQWSQALHLQRRRCRRVHRLRRHDSRRMERPRGLSAVVVPGGTAGMSVWRRYTFMGRRGWRCRRGRVRRLPRARPIICWARRAAACASCARCSTSSGSFSAVLGLGVARSALAYREGARAASRRLRREARRQGADLASTSRR